MKTLNIENPTRVKRAIPVIEAKIKIKINYRAGKVSISGPELNEFLVEKIIHAIEFGFNVEDALLLKKEDFVLEFLNIKDYARRKNLEDIRARVIGRQGKAKMTIEELTGSVIVINNNKVGIIVDSEHLDPVIQGFISLIKGAKHSNVFSYLEKQNANSRKLDEEDLGLKNDHKD